jgi:hypothetical protein
VEPSNDAGLFTFNKIDYGRYFIKVSYVGFQDFIIPEVNVDKPQINLLAGSHLLSPPKSFRKLS